MAGVLADLDPPRIGPPGPNPLADMDRGVQIRGGVQIRCDTGSPVFSINFTNRLIPAKPKYLLSIENSQAILKYFIDLKSETSVNQTLDLRSIKHFRIA